jgi:carbon starvation protein
VCLTAGWQKIFAADPRLGFLSHATRVRDQIASGAVDPAIGARLIFNDRLDAVVAAVFMTITVVLVIASAREWIAVLRGKKPAETKETAFVESAYA